MKFFLNTIFVLSLIYIIMIPPFLILFGKDQNFAWLFISSGIIAVLLSRIETITEISLGPFRATMKEKIQEIDQILKTLRKFASNIGAYSLTDLMAGGFANSMSLRKRLELHDLIIKNLQEIGVDDEQIKLTEQEWRKGICIIYHRIIRQSFEERKNKNQVNSDATKEVLETSRKFGKLLDFKNWETPKPGIVRNFLESEGHEISEDVQAWIDDYQHFVDTNEIRRRELFERG